MKPVTEEKGFTSQERIALYEKFLGFISDDVQKQRRQLHRRMFILLGWCFVAPALFTLALLLLVKFHILPAPYRAFTEWGMIGFPVLYTLYVLGDEVLREMPSLFRKGGLSNTLLTNLRESQWREHTIDQMKRSLYNSPADWRWMMKNYQIDMARFRARHHFLTILSSAVFGLINYGIGRLSEPEEVNFIQHPTMGLIQFSTDWSQTIVVVLFLVLFYLSGMQTYQSLHRYYECLEVAANDIA